MFWIVYFPKFIKANEVKPFSLKNCTVVIDGTTFMYDLYEESGLPFAFGCESDKFAEYLRTRLNMFKEANLNCYFVFKGGNYNIGKRIKYLGHTTNGEKYDLVEHNKFVPPLLIREVYTQVLDEMGILYAVCEQDPATECAALAERLSCPVIGRNIDYCFLKAPYILQQTLEYNPKTGAIECQQYRRADYLRKHWLTEQKLAMFVVLTDPNIFPQGFFTDFLKSLGVIHGATGYVAFIALWRWLSKLKATVALDIIYEYLKKEDQIKFKSEMYRIMDFMQNKRQSLVAEYLFNDGHLNIMQSDPKWFEKGIVTKRIAAYYINLYRYNYLFRQGLVESTSSRSSLLLSIDVVKYAYNLLTDFKRDEFKYMIGSEEMRIQAKRAPGAIQTPAFPNGWSDVKKLGLFENFLKENSINEALIAQAPSDAAMLLIALVYFARKKSSDNVSVEREVYSVITCFAMMAGSGDIAADDRAAAGEATRGYFEVSAGEMTRIFDRESLHSLVELQQCLQQLNYLNVLCGSPYEPTVYHRACNGTFVYKLFRDMVDSDRDCAAFVNNLFNCSTSVACYINKLVGLYKKLL